MGDEQANPYAAPDAGGSSPVVLAHDATCDRLATLGLMSGAGAVVTFTAYWFASPATTDLWFCASLGLMTVALTLGLASLVLSRVRHVRRGRAKAALLLGVSPVLFVVTIYLLMFGSMWLWIQVMSALGIGY